MPTISNPAVNTYLVISGDSKEHLMQADAEAAPQTMQEEELEVDELLEGGKQTSQASLGAPRSIAPRLTRQISHPRRSSITFSPLPMIGQAAREQKIGKVSTYWTSEELRNLFRLVDAKKQNLMDHDAFIKAISLMGFDTGNHAAITQLHAAADADGDGLIRETEFTQFFQNLSRQNIAARLHESEKTARKSLELQKKSKHKGNRTPHHSKFYGRAKKSGPSEDPNATTVQIIDFGYDQGVGQFSQREFDTGLGLIDIKVDETHQWERHIRWVDVYSTNREVIELLGHVMDLPPQKLQKYAFKQPGNVRFYPEYQVLQFLTHAMVLEGAPLEQVHFSGTNKLVKGSKYERNPPQLKLMQILILIKGTTVLSYRRPASTEKLRNVFEDVPRDIELFCESLRNESQFTSTCGFAITLLNEILERSWVVRDNFKDWKIELEKDIQLNISNQHTRMILDLGRNASIAKNIIRPWAKALGELLGDTEQDERDDGENHASGKNRNSSIVRASTAMGIGPDKSHYTAPRHHKTHYTAARHFVQRELDELRDISANVSRLDSNFAFTREISVELLTIHNNISDRRINKILYVLTVVTTIVAPVTLLTGVYGMNFDNMPELRFHDSYYIFLSVLLLYFSITIFYVTRRGLLF
eukprot:gb/GEZN01002708.1/.p1 GENE.gb/GEZN01002708.1/~~gb/GEZN01002708.1/.p1  ORF type:complete len:643 (+),score=76.61 gb/GEZN01002708.1/:319-2247(+)